MRACSTANAVCAGLLVGVGLFAACSSSPPSETPPAATDSPTTTAPSAATEPEPAPAATTSTADKAKKAETVADCKELLSEITNEPAADAGVVMNNATTAADAGSSDRFASMVELMRQKRDGFRCCFDIWAKKNPGSAGKVTFVFQLDPAGKLKKSFFKQDETTIKAAEVESCMNELATTLTYPKSPSAKDTEYTHRFEFKARN
jgi:hypothetical protein